MNPTDDARTHDARTHDARTDEPVSITEIADFLRQLRGLSMPMPPPHGSQPARDPAAERAAFLARKADLFARIAAGHPELTPPTPAPPTPAPPTPAPPTPAPPTPAPPTARQDEGST